MNLLAILLVVLLVGIGHPRAQVLGGSAPANIAAGSVGNCPKYLTTFGIGDSGGPCGGIASIIPGYGLTSMVGTQNTGSQTITNGGTISPQLFPIAKTANYNLVAADTGNLLQANGGSAITFTMLNPGAAVGNTYQFGDESGHGFTITTVGGTANLTGNFSGGSAASQALPASSVATCVDFSTLYSCAVIYGDAARLGAANTWTAIQTYTNSDIKLLGSSTGATTFTSANAGASNFTLTFPAVTDTLAVLGTAQSFTAAQTMNSLAVTSSTQPANGVYLPAASTVGLVGATKLDLFSGASKVGDYNDTTASTWTLAAATTINNATFKVTTLAASTAIDVVCYTTVTGLFTEEPTGTTCTVSDERKKVGMKPIDRRHSLDIIMRSIPISFYYRPDLEDPAYHLGFGAQTLAQIAPELVTRDEQGVPNAVKQIELLPITWAAIQQMQQEIVALQRRVR